MKHIVAASLLFAILALASSGAVLAQSPRMVLIEEATNASCGPCASQNPFFEFYLDLPHNRDAIIPVVYHANWPGRDVMNAANPAMHNARVTYYGITGVPTAVVNGRIQPKSGNGYDGAPSDTLALSNAVRAAAGMSPISIGITEQMNGANGTVDVQVTSTTALASKKLRIVLVEGFHYYSNAGTNGEKDFPYIARLMLPNQTGRDLTLAPGETKTFTETFTVDPAWNAREMYIVAFVQDDGTKEVLQAGTDKLHMGLSAGNGRAVLKAAVGEDHTFTADASIPVSDGYFVSVNSKLPQGWAADVRLNGISIADTATLTLAASAGVPLQVKITPADSKNRKGEVTVSVKGPRAASVTESFRLYSPDITVLTHLKDEGLPQIAANYEAAFEQCPWKYALVPRSDELLFDMNGYAVLVCEVGKSVLIQSDIDRLKSYFDKGGRTYMIGAEIAWGLADPAGPGYGAPNDIPFLHDYLHADYIADDNPSGTVSGFAGDPITDGMIFSFTTGVQNQDTPDQLGPRAGAAGILYYGTSQNAIAGLRYEDRKNRLVYLGFGLEGVGSLNSRSEMLRKGIEWLMLPTDVPELAAPIIGALDIYPNPAGEQWSVRVQLEKPSRVQIFLYDMQGRRVRTLLDGDDQAGATDHAFARLGLPAGNYLLHAVSGGKTVSRLFQMLR